MSGLRKPKSKAPIRASKKAAEPSRDVGVSRPTTNSMPSQAIPTGDRATEDLRDGNSMLSTLPRDAGEAPPPPRKRVVQQATHVVLDDTMTQMQRFLLESLTKLLHDEILEPWQHELLEKVFSTSDLHTLVLGQAIIDDFALSLMPADIIDSFVRLAAVKGYQWSPAKTKDRRRNSNRS